MLVIKGEIISGMEVGSVFVSLEWVKKQILEKFSFEPFLGTLNLKMDRITSCKFQSFTKSREGILIKPQDDKFCAGKCFKMRIQNKVDGALIIPLVPNYPHDQIEVIAPVNLRRVLGLEDGSEATIAIFDS
jgi:riboflavin kinase